jgi:alkylation response protein AidB-like acyl-CoA dehydrogenase
MNFELSDTEREMQRTARDFTDKEIVPIAAELDREDKHIPEHIVKKMGELGYFGMLVPEEYGGVGLGHVAYAIITEELSRGWLSVGSLPTRNIMLINLLLKPENEANRERWLSHLITGELQSAWSATEPEAGSDAANVQTIAKKSGNKWVLNGQKMFTTNGERANILTTLVRTDTEIKPKHRGLTIFGIEKEPGPGWNPPQIMGTKIPTVGYHGMGTYEISLQDCEVPEENMLTDLGKGFYALSASYETARIGFAARCVGVARAAFEAALAYVPTRVQFDQPISKFQAVRFKLAEMATGIDIARQYTYYAASKKDAGVRCDLEAGMAKLFASDMAMRVTWDAIQLHGGYGYSKELPLERYWRDAGLLPIGEGTSEIQKEVIARRLLNE